MGSKSNKTRLLHVVALFFCISLFTGCAFHRAEVIDPEALETKKLVFIYGIEDPLNLKESVRGGLKDLGFSVTEDKEEAELVADFNYKCYWDVIHYTCRKLNFYISDRGTKVIILQSRFWADTPFGPEKLVADLFEKVGEELKKKRAQPGAVH